MTLIVSVQSVRDYLQLEANNPTGSSRYTDGTIGSNILSAQSTLEQVTHRYLVNRTFTALAPWVSTSYTRLIIPIPAFRTFTSITWGGITLDPTPATASVWPIPDQQQTGVYTALQFRPPRLSLGGPSYLAYSDWFDVGRDLPWYPPNMGGGFVFTSMPNDLLIAGTAGYDETLPVDTAGGYPSAVLHAVKVLASFYTQRGPTLIADVAITPAGGVLNYSQMPGEVANFIRAWSIGQQAVAVGG